MSKLLLRITISVIVVCVMLYLLSYDCTFISKDNNSELSAFLYSNPLLGQRIEIKDSKGRTIKTVDISHKLNHEFYVDWGIPTIRIRFDREVFLNPNTNKNN